MQSAQIPNNYFVCPECDGQGLILQEPIQSGDLCRSSDQSPDVLGQENN